MKLLKFKSKVTPVGEIPGGSLVGIPHLPPHLPQFLFTSAELTVAKVYPMSACNSPKLALSLHPDWLTHSSKSSSSIVLVKHFLSYPTSRVEFATFYVLHSTNLMTLTMWFAITLPLASARLNFRRGRMPMLCLCPTLIQSPAGYTMKYFKNMDSCTLEQPIVETVLSSSPSSAACYLCGKYLCFDLLLHI